MIKTAVVLVLTPICATAYGKDYGRRFTNALESGKSSSDLTKAVSSPGGTVAALTEMKKCGFYDACCRHERV